MDKHTLLTKINSLQGLNQPEKDKILGWASSLPNLTSKVTPSEYKAGDVLMHPVFLHPYVLFEKQKDHWICGLITSEQSCAEILEACQSRFFTNNFFTKVIFSVKEPVGFFMSPYENKIHLTKVHKELSKIFR